MNNKKKIWLFVDDLREVEDHWNEHTCTANELKNAEIVVTRTYKDSYLFIKDNWNSIERISLDHDLGEWSNQRSGYELACLIEKLAMETDHVPEKLLCHSANPVGWKKIMATFDSIRKRSE